MAASPAGVEEQYQSSDPLASGVRGVALLGATGSIGTSALAVLARHPDRFRAVALTAHANADALADLVERVTPSYVGLVNGPVPNGQTWCTGEQCLIDAATRDDVHIVINAIVGAAGLPATLAALRAGKRVALANKETLVMAGHLVMRAAEQGDGELVPVDSEHSAIMQCLAGRTMRDVRRLILTASGGPFRTWSAAEIADATIADALQHPTWQMGSKITVDSATLANKALEVIEAHHFFGVPYERIEVVVHPQSIVHSFVEFIDGSVIAQLGVPSMELPILCALTWPERIADGGVPLFEPARQGRLDFEAVRHDQFPMLQLGIEAGKRGGAAPAIFNAANEVAVAHFLNGRIRFREIAVLVADALDRHGDLAGDSLEALLAADAATRNHVNMQVSQ